MTDARTTQAAVEVAAQADNTPARVTQAGATIALTGSPAATISQVVALVAHGDAQADIYVSQMCLQVLVSSYVKRMFTATWVK